MQRATLLLVSTLLTLAFAHRLYTRGGPYLEPAQTVMDHAGPNRHEICDALALLPKVEPLIPRGAQVACFRPDHGAAHEDHTNYLTAIGLLPRHNVVAPEVAAPGAADPVPYVVAVREPFENPAYEPIARFPEGTLYRVRR